MISLFKSLVLFILFYRALCVFPYSECCGSRSKGPVCIWAFPIRIRHYFVRIWILPSTSKKTLISTILWLLFDVFIYENWCKCTFRKYGNKQKPWIIEYFLCILSATNKKCRIRIRKSVVQICGSWSIPKCHGSTMLPMRIEVRSNYHKHSGASFFSPADAYQFRDQTIHIPLLGTVTRIPYIWVFYSLKIRTLF